MTDEEAERNRVAVARLRRDESRRALENWPTELTAGELARWPPGDLAALSVTIVTLRSSSGPTRVTGVTRRGRGQGGTQR